MKVKNAAGVEGILISDMDGRYYLRVYRKDINGDHIPDGDGPTSFDDYLLVHNDLSVIIDPDDEAAFYEYPSGKKYLDHAPATLGKDVEMEERSDVKIFENEYGEDNLGTCQHPLGCRSEAVYKFEQGNLCMMCADELVGDKK